jgi:endonuclease-3 related protein
LAIRGVGRETADSILVYALDKPFFIIDAYTRRIFGRAGLPIPADYDDLRALFEGSLEADAREYGHLHGLIVEHAKAHCLKTPSCEGCPLEGLCEGNMKY